VLRNQPKSAKFGHDIAALKWSKVLEIIFPPQATTIKLRSDSDILFTPPAICIGGSKSAKFGLVFALRQYNVETKWQNFKPALEAAMKVLFSS